MEQETFILIIAYWSIISLFMVLFWVKAIHEYSGKNELTPKRWIKFGVLGILIFPGLIVAGIGWVLVSIIFFLMDKIEKWLDAD